MLPTPAALTRSDSWTDVTEHLHLLKDSKNPHPLGNALEALPQWETSLRRACETRADLLLAERPEPALTPPARQVVIALFAHLAIRADHLALSRHAGKGPAPSGLIDVMANAKLFLEANDEAALGALLQDPACRRHLTDWTDLRVSGLMPGRHREAVESARDQAEVELSAVIKRLTRGAPRPLPPASPAGDGPAVLPITTA
ncbi:hypothetical protein [Mitsuaria sp. GD03876]|uniref:hypothetical protein n=1 Tax=Mitsuaria sp. GD03876 TaxID=2975399 RepID=UPI002448F704|nr:hypothetical protein [Mitsuaria sp. GD03876]MDH0866428.1 hypothetical protein [Mitsuaria sp. GD03876]